MVVFSVRQLLEGNARCVVGINSDDKAESFTFKNCEKGIELLLAWCVYTFWYTYDIMFTPMNSL